MQAQNKGGGMNLVLLHGYGSDENDMRGLAQELGIDANISVLRAPYQCPFGGYAWFAIDFESESKRYDLEQAVHSRDSVITFLESSNCRDVVLGGFSQGAMISLGVAIARPDLLSGLIILSGALLPPFRIDDPLESFKQLPKLIQHGELDDIVPYEMAADLSDWLRGIDAVFCFQSFPMGHSVSLESLDALRDWVSTLLI